MMSDFHRQPKLAFKSKAPGLEFKWQSRKILSSHSLTDTKTTTPYRTAVSENDLKAREQILYNYGYKDKATLKWVEGVETKSSQDLLYSPLPMW